MSLAPDWIDAIERYRAYLIAGGKAPHTIVVRVSHVRRLAESSTKSLVNLRQEQVLAFMSRKDWSLSTRRGARTSMVEFFRWAVDAHVVLEDLSRNLPLVPTPRAHHAQASPKAVERALEQADERTRMMLTLAWVLQLKALEIATVHPDDLDLDDEGYWVLRVRSARGIRRVEVPGPLAEAIRAHGHNWVFPGRIGGHVSPAYVSKLVSRTLPKGFTTEGLRSGSKARREADRAALQWLEVAGYHEPSDIELGIVEDARGEVVKEHLRRIDRDLNSDPAAAISHCKNLLESLCKIVLTERSVAFNERRDEAPALYGKVAKALGIDANSVPGDKRASEATRTMLRTLVTTVQSIAEVRNAVGTGHGSGVVTEVESRHARLAFNATVAVAEFIVESLRSASEV